MNNTDSFKAPDKYFAGDIENKDGITVDGWRFQHFNSR